ncbi:uncharacterized protein LOC142974654 isoform X2 [Anticarsia gemmatalis]|uniref:uncharacterized protein LOC142974654 isoform X2 n=1 Tax=Anticarsia gemmatalis TaxID=129554 RepID=UPI003F762F93
MMGLIWVVLLVALTGSHLGHCSPLRSTPQTYPHDAPRPLEGWGSEGGAYAAVPALALVLTAVGLLFGCTWCYRHKDCKLFTASATHLHDGRRAHPPDSGFSEPVNNNISEDNNNGPISLREMQNIANNNAAAYIVSENEERNRVSRESVVEFEPLPTGIRVADPLEHCADWFGDDDFPRDQLQYLREIERGWFGRVVEGEIEDAGTTTSVAVKILNQNVSLEDKARFLDEARMYRDVQHENVLAFIAKCLQEEPWILLFELCSMDLQQYLVVNRPKMAILNESGVPLRLMCDVTAALSHLHSRGYLYGNVWCGAVLIRGTSENARAVLGRYTTSEPPYDFSAPETRTHPPVYTASSDLWSLGTLVWEVCAWGAAPTRHPPSLPDLPCPYRNHLYQVMQLCWNPSPEARPSAQQVQALISHLHVQHRSAEVGGHSSDFEQRWQRLKPNSIPTRDEHRALVHAAGGAGPTRGDVTPLDSLGADEPVSRSSSMMSDKEPLHAKSASLTNLHGSLDDVRNIYLTHRETAAADCHQGNLGLHDRDAELERDHDRSDASMDPWLKDIIAGSQDDVSYYKDVSDVIKNLDNILNSEKTSSSESSHQASPSRDNLSLDCKKDYPVQSSMVKSPGITNFQNILDTGFSAKDEDQICEDDEIDRDTIGTLSHSFERHSEVDTASQHTLENLTPDTPIKDIDVVRNLEIQVEVNHPKDNVVDNVQNIELPNEIVSSVSEIPKLKELCVASIPSASDEQCIRKDCQTSCDSNLKSTDVKEETKSIDDVGKVNVTPQEVEYKETQHDLNTQVVKHIVLPESANQTRSEIQQSHEYLPEIKSSEEDSITNDVSITEVLVSDLIEERAEVSCRDEDSLEQNVQDVEPLSEERPEAVQSKSNESTNMNIKETETPIVLEETSIPLPPETVQNIFKSDNVTVKEIQFEREFTDDFAKESDFNRIEEDGDPISVGDTNVSEEQPCLDGIVHDSGDRTVAEETEENGYTNWINSVSTPQRLQDVSDFLRTEREYALLSESRTVSNEKTSNDDDFEMFTQEECLEASMAESQQAEQVLETSKDFSEDSFMKNSLQDVNDVVLDEITQVTSPVKEVKTEIDLSHTTEQKETPAPVVTEAENIQILDSLEIKDLKEDPKNVLESDKVLENVDTVETVAEEYKEFPVELVSAAAGSVDEIAPFVINNDLNIVKLESSVVKAEVIKHEETSLPKESSEHVVTNQEQVTVYDKTIETIVEELPKFEQQTEAHTDSEVVIKQDIDTTQDKPISEETNSSNQITDDSGTDKDISASRTVIFDEEKPGDTPRSEVLIKEGSDSTAYMDLINDTNEILTDTIDNNVRDVIKSCLESDATCTDDVCSLVKNESTEYLDLPSFGIKDVDNFLHMEKVFNSQDVQMVASTPLASDTSTNANNTLESSVKENSDTQLLSDTKVPNYGPGVSLTKLEQKYVPDSLSPFESPTKSHPTDTYDENSSVVLGPFENCTLELFKGVKSSELVDIPKEELLAFSSNFSEMNLETPSPLRDGNFLNEVPDIAHDDMQFDDIQSISDKPPSDPTETDSGNSGTEKRISPLTPPNSPGVFLASTSQQKYLVDIDLNTEPPLPEPDLSLQKEIELNQIELQITSKLAMAENENNMNIEYSGPLTVEGLVSEEGMLLRDSDALPESYLAGNGGSVEDLREDLTLDEECVKALRNELELKLPLAQVAAIEPQCESEWSSELPPPPELVVSYPGALSPIAEETGQQLSAYENDTQWNLSTRTESSESYPEPCNNSTDDVTELPGVEPSTYTLHERNHTYTLHKDLASSREITMSADSLNASPYKKPIADTESPIDDKTYTKEEEKESLERISQVSPFLLSPTTDTSAPDNSDNLDNATGVSTLSKTTLPTDAKLSKPSETQCLSKATSIDSWCSNDTLYNVEENFDDLAMDPDLPDFQPDKEEGNSESTDTLTHNEDEKEASHCSTYIIHDSKSEACETFSPDSITANDNYTYTKAKTENAGTTPSAVTTEQNDSTKNTQTKDLAYGTLMSGLPSYSNCTTEVVSGFDDWKVQQPELVRKSPMMNVVEVAPTNTSDDKVVDVTSPQLANEPTIKKMESVDISCLQENLSDSNNKTDLSETQDLIVAIESPNYNYKSMAPSVTSTPITDAIEDADVEPIPMTMPQVNVTEDSGNLPNFNVFLQSAEVRPQDLSSNASNECASNETEALLDGDSKTQSRNSNRDSLAVSELTPSYSDFENSAVTKPQDVISRDKSSQSNESGISSEDFQKFESSVRSRPQDLSSLIDASSLLLKSERMSSELAMGSMPSDHEQTSQETNEESQQSPPNVTNLNESHSLVNFREPNFLIDFDVDDETEQPHSIIITETTMETFKDSPSRPYETHTDVKLVEYNPTYESHTIKSHDDFEKLLEQKINGEMSKKEETVVPAISPVSEIVTVKAEIAPTPNTSIPNSSFKSEDVKCNGGSEKFATVNFLNETFEELIESNVDDGETKELENEGLPEPEVVESPKECKSIKDELQEVGVLNGVSEVNGKMAAVTEDFLQNEKKFCQLDAYLPLLSDIRFTGPAAEIMSTSFTQESPTEPTSCSRPAAADLVKEWDSDTDSHTSNSSSGEFIWKDGDGHETSLVPTTHFDHQRSGECQDSGCTPRDGSEGGAASGASDASGDSGSGSEGDEVEFVPSSWDCRAAPAKSSLRSLEQAAPVGDTKKRVVFKRQKYHCVYEYPREAADIDAHSPAAYLPDLSTYSEWDPSSAEEAELGYGQLFGAPSPLDLYPLRAGIAFGADYDEDFFISSSARPFESLGIMTSQFFPGKHVKPSLLERDLSDDVTEEFPPPPSPLPTTTLMQTRTPSLDFTTPDSGVEDITPGSTTDEDFKKKLPETELTWRPVDSGSSSESVSPSSPGGEALGGLRHTRDKLKLDLPPSPHIPSPRHNRVFNFVLDKPKRREERPELGTTPLVMTDETPIVTTSLPLQKQCEDLPVPEPTFSTFGKSAPKVEPEQKLILDEVEETTTEVKDESPSPKVVEAVKGEGTVLDSGDEDSGIESSSKATLERNKTNVS